MYYRITIQSPNKIDLDNKVSSFINRGWELDGDLVETEEYSQGLKLYRKQREVQVVGLVAEGYEF